MKGYLLFGVCTATAVWGRTLREPRQALIVLRAHWVLLLSKFVRAKSWRLLFVAAPATWTRWLEAFSSRSLIFLISLEFLHAWRLAWRNIPVLLMQKCHILLQRFQFHLMFLLLVTVYLALVDWLGLWESVVAKITLRIGLILDSTMLRTVDHRVAWLLGSFAERGRTWALLLGFLNTVWSDSSVFQIIQSSSSFVFVKPKRFLLATMVSDKGTLIHV